MHVPPVTRRWQLAATVKKRETPRRVIDRGAPSHKHWSTALNNQKKKKQLRCAPHMHTLSSSKLIIRAKLQMTLKVPALAVEEQSKKWKITDVGPPALPVHINGLAHPREIFPTCFVAFLLLFTQIRGIFEESLVSRVQVNCTQTADQTSRK